MGPISLCTLKLSVVTRPKQKRRAHGSYSRRPRRQNPAAAHPGSRRGHDGGFSPVRGLRLLPGFSSPSAGTAVMPGALWLRRFSMLKQPPPALFRRGSQ
jgi:hypothetical protein